MPTSTHSFFMSGFLVRKGVECLSESHSVDTVVTTSSHRLSKGSWLCGYLAFTQIVVFCGRPRARGLTLTCGQRIAVEGLYKDWGLVANLHETQKGSRLWTSPKMVSRSNLWSLGVCGQVVAPSLSHVDSKGSRGLVDHSDQRYDAICCCKKLYLTFSSAI